MSAQHIKIIRHPDLSRLSDKQLKNELIYTRNHAAHIGEIICSRIRTMEGDILLLRQPIPLRKWHEDYNACTERLEAIIDELQFRRWRRSVIATDKSDRDFLAFTKVDLEAAITALEEAIQK